MKFNPGPNVKEPGCKGKGQFVYSTTAQEICLNKERLIPVLFNDPLNGGLDGSCSFEGFPRLLQRESGTK